MAYLKDSKYVKNIAEVSNLRELTEEACRFALAEVELKLRELVDISARRSKMLNRNVIKAKDIESVLEDNNTDFLIKRNRKLWKDQYSFNQKEQRYELISEDIDIKEKMVSIIEGFKREEKKEISLELLPSTLLNQKSKKNGLDETAETIRPNFDAEIDKIQVNDNTFLIKKVESKVLTQQENEYFEGMRTVLNGYFQKIDSNVFMIDYKEFYYCKLIRSFYTKNNV